MICIARNQRAIPSIATGLALVMSASALYRAEAAVAADGNPPQGAARQGSTPTTAADALLRTRTPRESSRAWAGGYAAAVCALVVGTLVSGATTYLGA
ncbi:hypothetical protein ABZY44_18775 [Streptomyces sp. NPDC006544]|uniref:hypothetical protein n=1 Tax=Streptomyces sp. NPDC006544 TaxID=3154583 RepID=UPI0033A3B3B1